jgi:integrase
MMTPHPMIERRLTRLGVGRLRVSAGSSTPRVIRRRESLIDQLIDDGQVSVLRALIDESISIAMLDDYAREHPLTGAGLAVLVRGQTTLAVAFADALRKMGTGATNARYSLSLDAVTATYGPDTLVRDLPTLDWSKLLLTRKSAADAHHIRRAVSRFLSVWYGKQHPARFAVLAMFPPLPVERGRVPELTPQMFAQIVGAARLDIRPALVTLALTGLRVGEYLALRPEHLRENTHRIAVPGTKTAASAATVSVDPQWWPVVKAAVPCPVQYRRLWQLWTDAVTVCGFTGLRIHDLRHAHGQWAVDAGASEAGVQRSLRHTSGAMTRRYTMSNDTRAVSAALSAAVAPALAAIGEAGE